MMQRGLFITFEGPDGSGKTTQIELLRRYLEEKGYRSLITREPGGTVIGEKIRTIILDKEHTEMDAVAEALLYAAARAQHVAQVIRPALSSGTMVICDRFTDSSVAYQGYGRQLGEAVEEVNRFATRNLSPDVTFLMRLSPAIGQKRIREEERDRLEMEKLEFHNRVFDGYKELERDNRGRIIGIDASGTIEEIHGKICRRMEELLQCR